MQALLHSFGAHILIPKKSLIEYCDFGILGQAPLIKSKHSFFFVVFFLHWLRKVFETELKYKTYTDFEMTFLARCQIQMSVLNIISAANVCFHRRESPP